MDWLTYDQLPKMNFKLCVENSQHWKEHFRFHPEQIALREKVSLWHTSVKRSEDTIDGLQTKLDKNAKNNYKSPFFTQKLNLPIVQGKEHRPHHLRSSHPLFAKDRITGLETQLFRQSSGCRFTKMPTHELQKNNQVDMPPCNLSMHPIELVPTQSACCQLQTQFQRCTPKALFLALKTEALVNPLTGQYYSSHQVVRLMIVDHLCALLLSHSSTLKMKKCAAARLAPFYNQWLQAIAFSLLSLHLDVRSWPHAGNNECAIVLQSESGMVIAVSARQIILMSRDIEPFFTNLRLADFCVIAKLKQYCLIHLLHIIRGLAKNPTITNDQAQNLGKRCDKGRALLTDEQPLVGGEISESSSEQNVYQSFPHMPKKSGSPKRRQRRFCSRNLYRVEHFQTYLKTPLPMRYNQTEEAFRNHIRARKLCFRTQPRLAKAMANGLQLEGNTV